MTNKLNPEQKRTPAPEPRFYGTVEEAKKAKGPEAVFKILHPDARVEYAVARSRQHVCSALVARLGFKVRGGTGGSNRRRWFRKEELAKLLTPEQLASLETS